jgi:uncharacterized protein YukE
MSPANLRLVRGAGGVLRMAAGHCAHASETYAVMLEQILGWSGHMQKSWTGAHGVAFQETINNRHEAVGMHIGLEDGSARLLFS